jgi:hypothetical protein
MFLIKDIELISEFSWENSEEAYQGESYLKWEEGQTKLLLLLYKECKEWDKFIGSC